ncbi:hypothetical protein AM493_16125 [Flavobacterium akiainvivens]|uniref:NAD(P)-binding domain-containing protein n=1 Tax=Flavobacterium akiainvivens TaxID=1202724 RepID=A0A0M8MKH7_9FLAO|nr:SDR family oxidoreductase [Flavobacterium akiainvivens]KOS07398.1 hypothetical protein AM493_16125 [Flavobacterium akiainvivens]SFQ47670.1 Uncharacterized conserved protein YbjT, contains NAD(P)-binding and DUF2867 domains [Flavobacterium akiainvivens]
MENILITGGTGNLGKGLTQILNQKGLQYAVASRSNNENAPNKVVADLMANKGVAQAVKGRSIIFHLATDLKKDTLLTQNLLQTIGSNKNVHLIYISIVGIDKTPFNYYQQKLASEELIKASGVPYTILRATQFHDFIDYIFTSLLKYRIGLLPKKVMAQPIAVDAVANALYEISLQPAESKTYEIGGLKAYTFNEMAKEWMRKTGKKKFIINLPLFGKLAKAFNGGALLTHTIDATSKSWQDYLNQKYK